MRASVLAPVFAIALAAPAVAQTPVYNTLAPYAFMKDLSSGAILYDKASDTRIPPASMSKMMTVYVAFQMIMARQASLDQKITVRPETWRKWHSQGSTMFLAVGEQPTVEQLLHGIITLSGNDACVTLGEGLAGNEDSYVALMNQAAKKIGLTGSHFANTNGWPDAGEYVTPRDLAMIAERTIRDFPDLYRKFYGTESFTWGKTLGAGKDIVQANRNPILGKVSGADGLKTGHTDEAGYGFTGSAMQGGRRLVMVVAGLKSWNDRVSSSIDFMNWGFNAWTSIPVVKAGQAVGTVPVSGGDKDSVDVVAPRDLALTMPKGAAGQPQRRLVATPVKAPIAKGAQVAVLEVTVPGAPVARLPLVAAEPVGEATGFRRFTNWLKSLVGK